MPYPIDRLKNNFISCVKVEVQVAQSCPTLSDPMDYTVHEILQARILEGVFPTQRSNPGLLHCRRILY